MKVTGAVALPTMDMSKILVGNITGSLCRTDSETSLTGEGSFSSEFLAALEESGKQ